MPTGEELYFRKVAERQKIIDEASTPKQKKKGKRKLRNVTQKSYGAQRQGIDTTRVPQVPGTQGHHLTSLNNAASFFDGLDLNEKAIMGQRFAQYGLIPGDLSMNRLDIFTRLHQGGIHAIESKNALNLAGKQYFKPGATFLEKYNAVEKFAADQKLLADIARRMQYTAEFGTSGLTERVEATATPKKAAEYHAKDRQRLAELWRDFAEYGPEQHEVAKALGPQKRSDNAARLAALEPYFNSDGSFDTERLKADVSSGAFKLPPAGPATDFPNTPDYSKGTVTLKSARLRKAAGLLPVAGAAVGFSIAGSQAMAGDIEGAKVTAFETAVGEIPVVGDIFTADPAAGGTLEAASATQRAVEERRLNPTAADKFFRDPLNELEYAGKQLIGGLKTVGGAILFGF